MIFSLAVYASPSSSSSYSAWRFAEAVLRQGHDIHRVFFYCDGAYHGSHLQQPPQGESAIQTRWQQLQVDHNIDLVVCIAAGLKRGIIDHSEAQRYTLPANNLCDGMRLAGLGELMDAMHSSDRLINFGG